MYVECSTVFKWRSVALQQIGQYQIFINEWINKQKQSVSIESNYVDSVCMYRLKIYLKFNLYDFRIEFIVSVTWFRMPHILELRLRIDRSKRNSIKMCVFFSSGRPWIIWSKNQPQICEEIRRKRKKANSNVCKLRISAHQKLHNIIIVANRIS